MAESYATFETLAPPALMVVLCRRVPFAALGHGPGSNSRGCRIPATDCGGVLPNHWLHRAVVKSIGFWCWLADLLEELGGEYVGTPYRDVADKGYVNT